MQNTSQMILKSDFFERNSIEKVKIISRLIKGRKLSQFSVLLLLIVFLTQIININAQSSAIPNAAKPGSYGGASGLSDFETINPYSGSLNFNLPLIAVGGRGAVSSSASLTINQKYIAKSWSWADDPFQNWYAQDYATDTYTPFTKGFSPGLLLIDQIGTGEMYCPYDAGYNHYQQTLTKIRFVAPDGTEYSFRDRASNGQPLNIALCQLNTPTRGTVFDATDGSAATFISDTAIGDNIYPGSPATYTHGNGYVMLRNGTRYRIELGQVAWQQDSNGNKIFYSYTFDPDGRVAVSQIIDSLNREILFEYGVQDVAPYGLCDRITYKGFNGVTKVIRISYKNLADVLRSGYSIQTRGQLFPDIYNQACNPYGGAGECASYVTNPKKPSAVWLADGKSYKFQYNSYAELARVELPTGGAIEYDWTNGFSVGSGYLRGMIPPGFGGGPDIYRRITERRSYSDGVNVSNKLKIGGPEHITGNKGYVVEGQYDSNDNLISKTKHYYYGIDQTPVTSGDNFYYESWQNGREYQTEYYASDGTTLLRTVLTEWKNKVVAWASNQDSAPQYDLRTARQVFITIENGKALAVLKNTEYDENGSSDPAFFSHLNVKKTKSYNYKVLSLSAAQTADLQTISAMFSESDLVAVSEADYLYNEGYKTRNILGVLVESRVLNPSNPSDVLAKSQFLYDEQSQYYSMLDYGSTVSYQAPTGNYAYLRGNVTTHRSWLKDTNTWLQTHTQYDNFGNVRKSWDPSGDTTRFVEVEYSSQHYYAYPTKKITPAPDPTGIHGTTESSNVLTTYDFWTGKVLTVTDANGQVTSIEYDNLLRLKKITPPAGGSITEREYGDTPGSVYVKIRTQADSQNWAESTTFFDRSGRVYKTQNKDLQGDVFSEVQYDDFGRIKQVSNPYRQGEQKLWSKPRYDIAGRVVEAYAPAPDGQLGASIGTVELGISTVPGFIGNYAEATDASGRKVRTITNVYGQTVRVDEPTGNNNLGTLENPNQPSYYTYNIKGELIKTQQGQQNRYFMYDSSGRLIRVKQPEQTANPNLATTGNPENNQWTTGFTYDIFDNVISVTDAKGTVIANDYDKAGRVKTTSYSDATPQVNYYYDGTGLPQAPQFAKGNLTKVTNGVSETRYTSFDNYGRMLANQQITDGQTYAFGYKYDSVGNLTEETYPSLRVVKTHLAADGSLAAVSSKTANTAYKTYASGFKYTSAGAVQAMMLGNGRWQTSQLNSRSQLTQIGLGNSATDASLWKVDYEYGELNTDGTTVDTAKNTGSIAKQTITLPTANFIQTYKYDELNRLTEARETTGSTQNWRQTFDYDRYGNRTGFSQIIGSNQLPTTNLTHATIDPGTNRFTAGQGYVYDFNGNLIQDAQNRSFAFDGDDKQTAIRDLNIQTSPANPDANVVGRYYYDGSGQRVKKVTNTETTIFVYDGSGDLVAEYSTQVSSEPTTSYLTTDRLGSPRVITDKQGNVISRRDFMPFGEEILAGVGGRTTNQKYSTSGIDNNRQRFTGYEKDAETDLDFAQARMYQNKHGRFTAPDPLLSSASLTNPQTFNRYAYVGNNPVNVTDPSGLDWCVEKGGDGKARFLGPGTPCDTDKNDGKERYKVTRARSTADGVDSNERQVREGEMVNLHDDGTVSVDRPLSQQESEKISVQVYAESDPVETTSPSIGDHLTSAFVTFVENNGGNAYYAVSGSQPYNQHTEGGQMVGNAASLIQSAVEISHGIGTTAISGTATAVAAPLCLTGVGCAVPAVTATITAAGVLEILHGGAVLGNTIYNMNANQGSASRSGGSGGQWSRNPQTLQDEMALEAAKKGAGTKIIDNLNDPQFKGMEKWEYKVKSSNGADSVVHYVKDPKTGNLMDFKFKKHSNGAVP
jgi:RHS repeat-associated protein